MRTHVETRVLTTTSTLITLASDFAGSAGDLVYAICLTRHGGAHTHTLSDDFAGSGAWTTYTVTATTGSDRVRISFGWVVLGATPGTHNVTCTLDANVGRRALSVWRIPAAEFNAASPIRQNKTGAGTTSTTPSLTLDSAALTGNIVLGLFGNLFPTGSVTDVAPGVGAAWAQDREDSSATGTNDINLFQEFITSFTGTTVDASNMGTTNNVGIAVEINAATAPSRLLLMHASGLLNSRCIW